jgi:hypothetical protein
MADTRHDGVVNGGVTQRASDPKPSDVVVCVHLGLNADDRIHLQ